MEMNKKKILEPSSEKDVSQKPAKFMKTKMKYSIINIISHLLTNSNNFNEKLSTDDIKIFLQCDSSSSTINNIKYSVKINNKSFNLKRDTLVNIEKYKELQKLIELNDEYYSRVGKMEETSLDLFPNLQKGIKVNLSSFPFYYYNKQNSNIEKYKIQNTNFSKIVLCIFSVRNEEDNLNEIKSVIKDVDEMENFWDYFEFVYVVYQVKNKEQIKDLISRFEEKIFFDNNHPEKFKHIFNFDSMYEDKNNNIPINIFHRDKREDYFFVIDKDNKIIKFKEIYSLIRTVELILKNDKKKSEKKLYEKEFLEIFKFVKNIDKLKYIFYMSFNFKLECFINKELDNIFINKIKSIKIKGEFRTKEYNWLKETFKKFENSKNFKLEINELPTIDIEIDFNDMKCFKCEKEIPMEKELYYCYICKKKYCYECVQEQLKKTGKQKFIDQKHNLLFFKTRNKELLKNLDKIKIGNNRFSESTDDDQFSSGHNANCNGCGSNFERSARYVCITCRPGKKLNNGFFDFCSKCIDNMCKDENKRREIERNSRESLFCDDNIFISGHKIENFHQHLNHVYMMIAAEYNNVGYPYYDF